MSPPSVQAPSVLVAPFGPAPTLQEQFYSPRLGAPQGPSPGLNHLIDPRHVGTWWVLGEVKGLGAR